MIQYINKYVGTINYRINPCFEMFFFETNLKMYFILQILVSKLFMNL